MDYIESTPGPNEQQLWFQGGGPENSAGCRFGFRSVVPGGSWEKCDKEMNAAMVAAGVNPEHWERFVKKVDKYAKSFHGPGWIDRFGSLSQILVILVLFVLLTSNSNYTTYLIIVCVACFVFAIARDKYLATKNQAVDKEISDHIHAHGLGHTVNVSYKTRHTGWPKRKGTLTQRMILIVGKTVAPPVAATQVVVVPTAPVVNAEMVPLVGNPATPARQIVVTVPPGAAPGQVLTVQAPTGEQVQAAVPEGAVEGSSFSVAY